MNENPTKEVEMIIGDSTRRINMNMDMTAIIGYLE